MALEARPLRSSALPLPSAALAISRFIFFNCLFSVPHLPAAALPVLFFSLCFARCTSSPSTCWSRALQLQKDRMRCIDSAMRRYRHVADAARDDALRKRNAWIVSWEYILLYMVDNFWVPLDFPLLNLSMSIYFLNPHEDSHLNLLLLLLWTEDRTRWTGESPSARILGGSIRSSSRR